MLTVVMLSNDILYAALLSDVVLPVIMLSVDTSSVTMLTVVMLSN
jgi:hypothetical protein